MIQATGPKTFTRKPGRPTASQAAAISEAIVRAATELFLAEGFDGASMEAVAARAGVPKTTLYKRYGDKKALLRAVLETRRADWSAAASQENWKLTGNPRERLAHYARIVLTWSMSPDVRAFRALAASAWSRPEEAPSRLEIIGQGEMLDLLERDIRELSQSAGAPARNPRRVAVTFMATLAGWLEVRGAAPTVSEQEATDFAETVTDLLVRGAAAW